MTPSNLAIMSILKQHGGEMYALQILKGSDGKLQRSKIYVELRHLENEGIVSSRKEDHRPVHSNHRTRRLLYKLTERGKSHLEKTEASD